MGSCLIKIKQIETGIFRIVTIDPLQPIYAASTIHVTHHGGRIDFMQVLIYDYVNISNDNSYHRRITREPGFAKQEIATIQENMQRYLDEETNVVNGEQVYPHVNRASIDFKTTAKYLSYTWYITFTGTEASNGKQVYEAVTEPETLEYDAKSTYIFPPEARIIDVESSLVHENVLNHVIVFRGSKGDTIKPLERLRWILEYPVATL